MNSVRKATPFFSPAFALWSSSTSNRIEPLAPPHAGHDEHDLHRVERLSTAQSTTVTHRFENTGVVRVIGAGVMPRKPDKDGCAELFEDELPQFLTALQQGTSVLGDLRGAAAPVARSQVAEEDLQTTLEAGLVEVASLHPHYSSLPRSSTWGCLLQNEKEFSSFVEL